MAENLASSQDKTFAYEIGHSAPFTVVQLDISTDERKNAVSEALKNIINAFGERNAMSEPYKGLLEKIKSTTVFLHAFQGGLSCLRYALRNAETDKELCISMLDSIKRSENNLTPVITLKGYTCLPKDKWEDHGLTCSIGQSVDDPSFYYARATDGEVTRDYEYDHEPSREEVISDHADKLAEEAIDHYEAEYGADGYRAFGSSNEQEKIVITVRKQRGTKNTFDVTSVGFDTEKRYTVAEFNQALKKANEIWEENWDGFAHPNDIVIINIDKSSFCLNQGKIDTLNTLLGVYRLNLADAAFNSIQEIVKLSPTPMYANISMDKTIEMLNAAEHIPQQQDISHNTTNAVPTAIRGESRGKVMEQNTKFEVSTMHKLEGDGPAKAIATLVVNGEFAVHGVKVVEGKNGLYAAMPSERQGNGEYKDVVFPVTSEARTAIENAMLDAYEKLSASPEQSLKNEIAAPEKPISKVYAQMHEVKSDNTQTKAAGQLTIDSCLVVTGVKLNEGTNSQGQTKNFVAMPARMNANGAYDDVAHPITADFHNTVEKSVMASVNNIGRYEYKGVKFEELGENPAKSAALHPKFADKLMEQLDKAGIPYQAKCAERTIISVAAENKPKFDTIKKELTDKLNAKDKPQQTQEQKQTTGTHSKSKK